MVGVPGCKKAIIVSSEIPQLRVCLVPENIFLQRRRLLNIIHDLQSNLEMSLDQVVQLEVLVVLSEWIVESLSHLQPSEVEEKFEGQEDRIVEIQLVPLILSLVTASWTGRAGLSSPPGNFPDRQQSNNSYSLLILIILLLKSDYARTYFSLLSKYCSPMRDIAK